MRHSKRPEREDFVLVGITGAKDEGTKVAAKAAGLAVMTAGKRIEHVEPTPQPEPVEEVSMSSTRVHHGNVRSGQQIYASGGSLVVLGSVSNGAVSLPMTVLTTSMARCADGH